MKIALIGTTGFVESEILKEALYRAHEVTFIVRNTDKISIENELLKTNSGLPQQIKNLKFHTFNN